MSKARCNSLEDVRNISMQTLSFASVKHLLSKQVYEITLLAIDIDNIDNIRTIVTTLGPLLNSEVFGTYIGRSNTAS